MTDAAPQPDFWEQIQQELDAADEEARAVLELTFDPKGAKAWCPVLELRRDAGIQEQLTEHLRREQCRPGKYRVRLRLHGRLAGERTVELSFAQPVAPPEPPRPREPNPGVAPAVAPAQVVDSFAQLAKGLDSLRKANEAFARLAGPDDDDEDDDDEEGDDEEEQAAAQAVPAQEQAAAPWWVEMFLAPLVPAVQSGLEAGVAVLKKYATPAAQTLGGAAAPVHSRPVPVVERVEVLQGEVEDEEQQELDEEISGGSARGDAA